MTVGSNKPLLSQLLSWLGLRTGLPPYFSQLMPSLDIAEPILFLPRASSPPYHILYSLSPKMTVGSNKPLLSQLLSWLGLRTGLPPYFSQLMPSLDIAKPVLFFPLASPPTYLILYSLSPKMTVGSNKPLLSQLLSWLGLRTGLPPYFSQLMPSLDIAKP